MIGPLFLILIKLTYDNKTGRSIFCTATIGARPPSRSRAMRREGLRRILLSSPTCSARGVAVEGVKTMNDEEAMSIVVERALGAADGRLNLANAEEFIIGELEQNRFNTERAI